MTSLPIKAPGTESLTNFLLDKISHTSSQLVAGGLVDILWDRGRTSGSLHLVSLDFTPRASPFY